MKLADFCIENRYCIDRTEAKRFLTQNKVTVNGERTDCWFIDLEKDGVISIVTPKSFKVFRVKQLDKVLKVCYTLYIRYSTYIGGEDMNTQQLMEGYKNYLKHTKKRSENTIRGYVSDLKHFLSATKSIENITRVEILDYVQELNKTLSAKTVHRRVASIQSLFDYMVNIVTGKQIGRAHV